MLKEHIILLILSIFAMQDVIKRRIHIIPVLIFFVGGALYQILLGDAAFAEIFGGILVGVILLGISRLTGEAIGYGDGLVFLVTGVFLGVWQNLNLLFTSLVIAFVYSSVQILLRKKKTKDEIPFVPFIWIADLLHLGGLYYEKIF